MLKFNQLVSVRLDFLGVDVKLTSMNAPLHHVTTVVVVLIYLRATDANVRLDFQVKIVKMKKLTVDQIHAQHGLCVRMNLAMEISLVCAVVDTPDEIVILPLIHAQRMEIHARMVPLALL